MKYDDEDFMNVMATTSKRPISRRNPAIPKRGSELQKRPTVTDPLVQADPLLDETSDDDFKSGRKLEDGSPTPSKLNHKTKRQPKIDLRKGHKAGDTNKWELAMAGRRPLSLRSIMSGLRVERLRRRFFEISGQGIRAQEAKFVLGQVADSKTTGSSQSIDISPHYKRIVDVPSKNPRRRSYAVVELAPRGCKCDIIQIMQKRFLDKFRLRKRSVGEGEGGKARSEVSHKVQRISREYDILFRKLKRLTELSFDLRNLVATTSSSGDVEIECEEGEKVYGMSSLLSARTTLLRRVAETIGSDSAKKYHVRIEAPSSAVLNWMGFVYAARIDWSGGEENEAVLKIGSQYGPSGLVAECCRLRQAEIQHQAHEKEDPDTSLKHTTEDVELLEEREEEEENSDACEASDGSIHQNSGSSSQSLGLSETFNDKGARSNEAEHNPTQRMEMIEVITLSPDSSPAKKERRASGAREDVDGGTAGSFLALPIREVDFDVWVDYEMHPSPLRAAHATPPKNGIEQENYAATSPDIFEDSSEEVDIPSEGGTRDLHVQEMAYRHNRDNVHLEVSQEDSTRDGDEKSVIGEQAARRLNRSGERRNTDEKTERAENTTYADLMETRKIQTIGSEGSSIESGRIVCVDLEATPKTRRKEFLTNRRVEAMSAELGNTLRSNWWELPSDLNSKVTLVEVEEASRKESLPGRRREAAFVVLEDTPSSSRREIPEDRRKEASFVDLGDTPDRSTTRREDSSSPILEAAFVDLVDAPKSQLYGRAKHRSPEQDSLFDSLHFYTSLKASEDKEDRSGEELQGVDQPHSPARECDVLSGLESMKTPVTRLMSRVAGKYRESGVKVLKRCDITPRPEYEAMDDSQLKMELARFGLRAMGRKRAVAKLAEIYDTTHPAREDLGSKMSALGECPETTSPVREDLLGSKMSALGECPETTSPVRKRAKQKVPRAEQHRTTEIHASEDNPTRQKRNREEEDEEDNPGEKTLNRSFSSEEGEEAVDGMMGAAEESFLLPGTLPKDIFGIRASFLRWIRQPQNVDVYHHVLALQPVSLEELHLRVTRADDPISGISRKALMTILDMLHITFSLPQAGWKRKHKS